MYIKKIQAILFLFFLFVRINAQLLPGFKLSGYFGEQQLLIEDSAREARILINAPEHGFKEKDRVMLIFYALPNGSTIEQTIGKVLKKGDDWQYDIQHIGAQTRLLRGILKKRTIVIAYLESKQKSWPAWKANMPDHGEKIKEIVNNVKELFIQWDPEIILNGHSGGGRFIFSYIDAVESIPSDIKRIAFLDSSYGYDDSAHGPKLAEWLRQDNKRYLCTLAYNDSVVIYNGKPLVSPEGGTWYRSKLMKNFLSGQFKLKEYDRDSLLWVRNRSGRIEFIFKNNPCGEIFHTTQVELNGFIHSILSGTRYSQKGYSYYGKRAYSGLITDSVAIPVRRLNIPANTGKAEPGSEFMLRISGLSLEEREEEIYKALAAGNIPRFLRSTVTLSGSFYDSEGVLHSVVYEAMPDYLSVGTEDDYCRIPMNPYTAQKLADKFGGSLLTSVISDHIYELAEIKIKPFNYLPVGNANETVQKFKEHSDQIDSQISDAGGRKGQLVAGIKKDVILSRDIALKPGKVVIYGWHNPGGKPIQPVYSGHIWWYVDYSHGIRLVNNQVIIDGKPALLSEILQDKILYRIFSNENSPMEKPYYSIPE